MKIRNLTERARVAAPAVRASVESGLLYPLLRGQNVGRWSAQPVDAILLPHQPGMKLRAVPEMELAAASPRAFAYLKKFEPLLRRRAAFRRYFKTGAPFYSLFNIGDYTFAPWKVVWREQAWPFTAAVCGPKEGRVVIPDHKLMLVAAASGTEAHFLCGALNSLPVAAAATAYAVATQIGTHILDLIAVPGFDRGDRVHARLAYWSGAAHRAVRAGDSARLLKAEEQIRRWAARLWNLTIPDVEELAAFLQEAGVNRA